MPVITSQPGFSIAIVEATRNGVPPSKSVRKTMSCLPSRLPIACSSCEVSSAVVEVSGKSMATNCSCSPRICFIAFSSPLANPPWPVKIMPNIEDLFNLKEVTELTDYAQNHRDANQA
ncbi:hypothetical protein D3C71_1716150 [compost metagenome]